LKVALKTGDESSTKVLLDLLSNVLVEQAIISSSTGAFDALIASLKGSEPTELAAQLQFLDNCLCRIAKKAVHYQDLAAKLLEDDSAPLSLLIVAVLEQWPFVLKSKDTDKEQSIARWVASLIKQLKAAGEDKKALKNVRDSLSELSEAKKTKSIFKKALKGSGEKEEVDENHEMEDAEPSDRPKLGASSDATVGLLDMFGPLPRESKDHAGLYKWEKEEIDVAIEQGRVSDLLLCLCSEHEEIRRQAFAAISRLMVKLKVSRRSRLKFLLYDINKLYQDSKYTEWKAVYLLLGEIRETVNQLGFESSLPSIAGRCAVACLMVLHEPLNKMYGKVNRYLQRRPWWEVDKIPSYWIDQILLHEPEDDEGHYDEVNWLLDMLVNGLQTPEVSLSI
jgi:nucleolar pre-ribosomal-associated protein 1